MIKINLGAGNKPEKGWHNYDINPVNNSVINIDFEKDRIPQNDSTVDIAKAFHLLEHLENLPFFMDEVWRVLRPDGKFHVEVPRYPHEDAVKDPTHVRFFVPETFNYFCYKATCEMYGWKQWEVVKMESAENLIKTILSPVK